MKFIQSQSTSILISDVTEEEYDKLQYVIDTEWNLINYALPFPSRKGPEYATVLLQAGMGCGGGRWYNEYLPEIINMFGESRIINTLSFE